MSTQKRILVTGSRDWADQDAIARVLLPYLPASGSLTHTVVLVHGDCPTGADAFASLWWTANGGLEEPHPVNHEVHGPWPAAGPRRNQEMVDAGASVCLAFIGPCTSPRCRKPGLHESHGTTGCANKAEAAGIPTLRYYAPELRQPGLDFGESA